MKHAFQALPLNTVLGHIGVGMASASFWRGAWYMLDDCLYPGDPFRSAMASFGLGTVGMLASQGLVNRMDALAATTSNTVFSLHSHSKGVGNWHWRIGQVARFGAIYALAGSCILIWRGTWVMWDVVYEHAHHCPIQKTGPRATDEHHATYSGLVSHLTAVVGLLSCGLFASVLAPPAAVAVVTNAAVTAASRPQVRNSASLHLPRSYALMHTTTLSRHAATSSAVRKHISPRNDRVLARPSSFTFGMQGSGGVMGMSSSAQSSTRRNFSASTFG